ncbi:MAG: TetR/AcrR family transcriptional regulator [Rhizobiaceae bacterium]
MKFVKVLLNENTKIVKLKMTESEKKYAAAALQVFKRFGVRKATMEEIALEAGVSKPTLYATFRNKDQALAATIRLAKEAAVETVRTSWQGADSLDRKLDLFFERLVVAGYDLLHNSPDADAFENAIGEFSGQAISATRKLEAELLAEAFSAHPAIANHGATPEQYATFVVTAAMQAKRQSNSRTDLLAFLSALKLSVLAVAGENESADV